jgi:hypothetical protein
MNPAFCPIVALIMWLREAGIQYGPIFPGLDRSHTKVNIGTRMGTGTYKRWLHDFFRYVGGGMAGCSSHSVRKSAASWATRCGASDPEIQRVGRWAILSVSFRRYLDHGITIQKKYLGVLRQTHDPVFHFWVFKTGVVDARN